MNINIIVVFFGDIRSIERKLLNRTYDTSACGDPTSYTPPNADYTFTFFLAPQTIKDRKNFLMCIRPFTSNVRGVLIDDSVHSSISKTLICDIAIELSVDIPSVIETL